MNKVFLILKTKASSFGFNKNELMGIAEYISNNQQLTDDSTDEEINAAIEAVIPYLKIGQQQASRIANSNKPEPKSGNDIPPSVTVPQQSSEEEPSWFKAYRESQEKRFAELEGAKVQDTRMSKLSDVLKDTGAYGASIISNAKRMSFKDDADFDEWLSQVETDAAAFKQNQSNEDLGKNAKPNGSNGDGIQKDLTESEIDDLVSKM